VFVARQRFAVLDKNRQILIKNFQNEVTKKCAPPHASTDCLFPVGTGMLLLRSEERISLFDVQQRKAVAELSTPAVKYVVWSPDNSHVALLSKHGVVIANKKLEQLCMVHETIRIKSGAWDAIHVVEVQPQGKTAHYKLTTTPTRQSGSPLGHHNPVCCTAFLRGARDYAFLGICLPHG